MLWRKCKTTIVLLFTLFFINASGAFVGINIGTEMSVPPQASTTVSILKSKNITHVRLFDADHQLLTALSNTGIQVTLTLPNADLLRVGQSRSAAADWINKNVAAFLPSTNITYISVGNEVLTRIPNAALVLVPALQFLQSAVLAADLNTQVKISSPVSMDLVTKPFPPSTAVFNSSWNSIMGQYLGFLRNTGSVLMLNVEPYYGYTKGGGIFPLEYALFQSQNPNTQNVDPNTNFVYQNMFDAMVDAAYYSMKALNYTDIPILVTETGWPWLGGPKESDANVDNALAYNSNLIKHVLNNSGTPSQPHTQVSAYIYELFNEDLKRGAISEQNWGIVYPNGSTMYSLTFDGSTQTTDSVGTTGLSGVFCVANGNATAGALKQGLDWACGPGSANCSAIQPGQPCYQADNIVAVASYAFNDYYHRTQASGGTCNFNNTAMLTSINPSYGSCVFAGSSGSSGLGTGATALGPIGPDSFAVTKYQESRLCYVISLLLISLVLL